MKLFLLLLLSASLYALPFKLIKKGDENASSTLLVIGGIHGNEPGGYFAASILATHYKIEKNALWVVPNLNAPSIQANKRGINGDMNRKFYKIAPNDPDINRVKQIKKIILSPKVSLVLNLHDGHGFYRKKYQGSIFNPNAWGQTCVIDQCEINATKRFAKLDKIANSVKNSINKKLIKKHHAFDVKNTNTKFDDEAMRKSLTFFAVTHNKPAFAIETSKNLTSLSQKVFYQLLAIEEFMKITDIKYRRDFDMNIENIKKLVQNYGFLYINDKIVLNLSDIKKTLRFIPLKSIHNTFRFTHPLGSVKRDKSGFYNIYIGNKRLTALFPQYFEIAKDCPVTATVFSNKKKHKVKIPYEFFVKGSFVVKRMDNIRVNVIGFSSKQGIDESEIRIPYERLNKSYSIDRSNLIYRVEFYKANEFCGMSLIHFRK